MKVSIIIPTKNRWSLLMETLHNILQQTLAPYEIIVVDDGSTDDTKEKLASEFKDKVIYLANKGKGPGSARNTGMEVATGEFIKFFDSDDLMTRNMLEVQVKAFEAGDKTFIYSSYFQAKTEGGNWKPVNDIILHYFSFPNSHPLNYWMCRGLFLPIPGMLFRKELLLEVGKWRTDVTAYEDFDYLWRIGLVIPFPKHVNDCAFLYRTHGKQITEHDFTHQQRDRDKVLVFEKILNDYFPEYLNSVDFKNLFMKIAFLPHHFPKPNKYELFLSKTIFQISDKIGRIKTNTAWQPHSGPLLSKTKVDDYLSKIL